MSTAYLSGASTNVGSFTAKPRPRSFTADSSSQMAYLEDTVSRMGLRLEAFQVASGWFAAVFQPDQNCALGVAVDQPTRATAVALAVDDAMKATRFDFKALPPVEPVKRRRSFEP